MVLRDLQMTSKRQCGPCSAWRAPGCLFLLVVVAFSDAGASIVPRFEVVPIKAANAGEGRLSSLTEQANSESFISRVFGSDCYSDALSAIKGECRTLDHDGKTRLALAFANCHLYKLGKKTYPCNKQMSIQKCVDHAGDMEFFHTHMQFFSEVDSMCVFLQNQNFQRHTEQMMGLMAEGGQQAAARLLHVNASLTQQASHLSVMEGQLQHVGTQQVRLAAAVSEGLASLEDLHTAAGVLDGKIEQSLANEALVLRGQESALVGLAQIESQQHHVLKAASELWQLAHTNAAKLGEAQQQHSIVQLKVLGDLRVLAGSTQGLHDTLSTISSYQQRSDAILTHLLGRSYGLPDILFYVAGGVASLAAGAAPITRSARLPLLSVFGSALAAERLLLERLQPFGMLSPGPDGQVLLTLPAPRWLPLGPAEELKTVTFDYKTTVRRLALVLAAACLLAAMTFYRNYEQANHQLLQRLQKRLEEAQGSFRADVQAAARKEREQVVADMEAMLVHHGVISAPSRPMAAPYSGSYIKPLPLPLPPKGIADQLQEQFQLEITEGIVPPVQHDSYGRSRATSAFNGGKLPTNSDQVPVAAPPLVSRAPCQGQKMNNSSKNGDGVQHRSQPCTQVGLVRSIGGAEVVSASQEIQRVVNIADDMAVSSAQRTQRKSTKRPAGDLEGNVALDSTISLGKTQDSKRQHT